MGLDLNCSVPSPHHLYSRARRRSLNYAAPDRFVFKLSEPYMWNFRETHHAAGQKFTVSTTRAAVTSLPSASLLQEMPTGLYYQQTEPPCVYASRSLDSVSVYNYIPEYGQQPINKRPVETAKTASWYAGDSVDDGYRCMRVPKCDTGSPLRKVISHLFGHNKSCTLAIPKSIWVYFCRKHYQRLRYRKPTSFVKCQIELAEVLLNRLQRWSEDNLSRGSGHYIREWVVSLRKKDQAHIHSAAQAAGDRVDMQSAKTTPQWLLCILGRGFSTQEMLFVVKRIRDDVTSGVLRHIPEVEFLPDIVLLAKNTSVEHNPYREGLSHAPSR